MNPSPTRPTDEETTRDELLKLARLVRDTRRLQDRYFDERKRGLPSASATLRFAKDSEQKLDAMVAPILSPPHPTLFRRDS